MTLFLIRYGEIALKSKAVRRRFQNMLLDNIHQHLIENRLECRSSTDHGRIYLQADDIARGILGRVFGIVSFSPVLETSSKMEDICHVAGDYSKGLFSEGRSFAVRARRTGEHSYTSVDLAREVGSAVYLANEEHHPKVDLGNPDIEVFVEVRQNRAFIFSEKERGPGGMPLGSQGRVVALVESENDIAAAWLIMKRGCRTFIITGDEELASDLGKWDPKLKVIVESKNDLQTLVDIAKYKRAEGIVLGWGMEKIGNEVRDIPLPIFYPLIGMSDDEVTSILDRIKQS